MEILSMIITILFIGTGIWSIVLAIKVFFKKAEKEKLKKTLIMFGASFLVLIIAVTLSPKPEIIEKKESVKQEKVVIEKEKSKKEIIKIQKEKERKEKEELEKKEKAEKAEKERKELQEKEEKNELEKLKEKYTALGYFSSEIFENKIYVQVGYFKLDKHRSFTYYTNETDIKNVVKFSKNLMNTEGYATNAHFFNNFEGTVSNNYSQTRENWAKGMNLTETNNKYRFFYYESFWNSNEFNKKYRIELGKIPKENGDIEGFKIDKD